LLLPLLSLQKKFDPKDKAINSTAKNLRAFLQNSANKPNDLKQVPGIGPAYEKALQTRGVHTTQQLIAEFVVFQSIRSRNDSSGATAVSLSCLGQCNMFYDWLYGNGVNKSDCCNKIVNAIAVKVNFALTGTCEAFLFTAGMTAQHCPTYNNTQNHAPLDAVISNANAVNVAVETEDDDNNTDSDNATDDSNNTDSDTDDNADDVLPQEPIPAVIPVAAAPVVAPVPVAVVQPVAPQQQQQPEQQLKQPVQHKFGWFAALIRGFILGVMFTLALAYYMDPLRLLNAQSGNHVGFADVCTRSQSTLPTLSDSAYIHGAIVIINSTAN
jgi:hypothetical protein